MRIATLTCPSCGTIVTAETLANERAMVCPRLRCEQVLRVEDLPADARRRVTRSE